MKHLNVWTVWRVSWTGGEQLFIAPKAMSKQDVKELFEDGLGRLFSKIEVELVIRRK